MDHVCVFLFGGSVLSVDSKANAKGRTKVLDQEPAIDETLMKLVHKLQTNFVDEKKVCMMDDWIGYFAWDVTANISFGRDYGFLDQEKDVDHL